MNNSLIQLTSVSTCKEQAEFRNILFEVHNNKLTRAGEDQN